MPRKRTKRSKVYKKGMTKSEEYDCESLDHDGLDYRIILNPSLKLRKIIDVGSAPVMAELSSTFTASEEWLHMQKSILKEIIRNAGVPEKSVPKTPRKAATVFARIRETVESYTSYSLMIEDQVENDDDNVNIHTEIEKHTTNTVVNGKQPISTNSNLQVDGTQSEPIQSDLCGSPYEDAHSSIGGGSPLSCGGSERSRAAGDQAEINGVEGSVQTSEIYASAAENLEQMERVQHAAYVKEECVSSPEETLQQSLLPCHAESTSASAFTVKQEFVPSGRTHPQPPHAKALADSSARVLRSTTRVKAATNSKTTSRPHFVGAAALSTRIEHSSQIVANRPRHHEENVLGGALQARIARVDHQHVVTTPCKREYKSAVQRVMEDQKIARTLSPKRTTVPTPSLTKTDVQNIYAAAVKQAARAKAEALRREKEKQVEKLREEQCRERAERVRKQREERELQVKRRKKEQEQEEQLKVEALRKKEELEERRREELRLQKTPVRSNAVSRNCSPARVPKMIANAQPRSTPKSLFSSTPGRVPAKVARIQGEKKDCLREPTMNTPSRETRRKPFTHRLEGLNSDKLGDRLPSPAQAQPNIREKREQLKRHVMEHGEKLRREEQERLRLKFTHKEHHFVQHVKAELEDLHSPQQELRRAEDEDMNRLRKEQEIRQRLSEEERRNLNDCEQALLQEQMEAARKEEEKRAEEERKGMMEKHRMREQVAEETRERLRAEEEEAKQRLNVSCSRELLNRHLANVSLNTSTAHSRTSFSQSSYEITPDKTYKPATENDYNIEDLSSGDETDSEDAPRKKVPSWAEGEEFARLLQSNRQKLMSKQFDPDQYFGGVFAPDLAVIFGKKKNYPRRGSSGIWESPISHPRQGIGAYQNRLNRRQ